MIRRKDMIKLKSILFLLVSLLSFSCSHTGTISIPKGSSLADGKGLYDLKAAVVVTTKQKNESVFISLWSADVTIKPYPEMYKAIQEKMKKVFSKVDLVDENSFVRENYDILINTPTRIEMHGIDFFR
jgi:hypothetical protein